MNREDIISEIKFQLGAPTVKVEIDDSSWDEVIAKALRWFKSKKGLIGMASFAVTDGIGDYPVPTDSYQLVDVILPSQRGFADLFPGMNDIGAELIPSWVYGYQPGNPMKFDVSGYVQMLQMLHMRRVAFGTDEGWFEQGGVVSITAPHISGNGLMFYKRKTFNLDELVGRDEEMFFRYCLAVAKHVLGRIRSKYDSYPAAGGAINTDGESLIAEAKEEFVLLEEEISDSQGNAGGLVKG